MDQKPRWLQMPLTELTTPTPGRLCIGARWWAVTEDGNALFFKHYTSPQCNANKAIVERLLGGQDYPGNAQPVFVEMAFLPHNCQDYY